MAITNNNDNNKSNNNVNKIMLSRFMIDGYGSEERNRKMDSKIKNLCNTLIRINVDLSMYV